MRRVFAGNRFAVGVLIAWAAAGATGGTITPRPAHAQKRSYTLDEDPIRLGGKALEQGKLADARARFEQALAAGYQPARAHLGLGQVAMREGRATEADQQFRAALSAEGADGVFAEANAALGTALLRQQRPEEAGRAFDAALARKSDLWEAQAGRARLLLQQQRFDEAHPLLQAGAKRKGVAEGEDAYHFGMALLYMGQDNLREAEKEALLALHQNPFDQEYAVLVGRIYEQRHTPELAIDAYQKALAAPGAAPSAPLLYALGGLYQKVGRYNDARDSYTQAVAADSTYAPALKDLAMLFQKANQDEMAARTWLSYRALVPDDVEALLRLSAACTSIRQYGPAVDAARNALAQDSTRVEARFAFARAGIFASDPALKADAARMFAALPETLDFTAQDWLALAAYQSSAKQLDGARRSLTQALRLEPASAAVHFQRGVLEMSAGQPDSAVPALQEAIRLDPSSAVYPLNLGIAHYQAKRRPAAMAAFRQALAINERLTAARLLLAQALADSDSLPAAEAAYQKVLESEPANAKALRGVGFCSIRRGAYGAAVKAYRAAADAEPGNADGWAGLGNAHLGQQDWAAAEQAFAKARAIDPANVTMRKGMEILERAREQSKQGG